MGPHGTKYLSGKGTKFEIEFTALDPVAPRRVPFFRISLDPGSDYLGGVVPKDGLGSGILAGSL